MEIGTKLSDIVSFVDVDGVELHLYFVCCILLISMILLRLNPKGSLTVLASW